MYKTQICFEILSQERIPEGMGLDTIILEAEEGGYVLGNYSDVDVEVDRATMSELLTAFGSDPGFFDLELDEEEDLPDHETLHDTDQLPR